MIPLARVQELQAKARTGSLSPAEKLEMSNLSKTVTPTTMAQTVPTKTQEQVDAAEVANVVKPENKSKILDAAGNAMKNVVGFPGYIAKTVDEAINGNPNLYSKDGAVTYKDIESMKLAMPQKEPLPTPQPVDPKDAAARKELADSMMRQGYSNVGDTTSSQRNIYPEFPVLQEQTPEVEAPEKKVVGTSFSPAPATDPVTQEAPVEANEPIPEVVSPKDKKSGFGDKLKELAGKYGVPMLEILQAVGYQRGGINKPTILEQKFEAALAQKQQEYIQNLEAQRQELEYQRQEKAAKQQQDFTANQNELDRIAEKQALGAELTSREKLALMTANQKTAAPGKAASLIPE